MEVWRKGLPEQEDPEWPSSITGMGELEEALLAAPDPLASPLRAAFRVAMRASLEIDISFDLAVELVRNPVWRYAWQSALRNLIDISTL